MVPEPGLFKLDSIRYEKKTICPFCAYGDNHDSACRGGESPLCDMV